MEGGVLSHFLDTDQDPGHKNYPSGLMRGGPKATHGCNGQTRHRLEGDRQLDSKFKSDFT
jgi:hypothetical protein